MKKSVDLLNGSILKGLTGLAFPIMLTSFLQMAYNLTDMIWIGRVGSEAVSAVGIASMLIWLSNGVVMVPRVGGQVSVARSIGAEKMEDAKAYAKTSFQIAIVLGIIYGAIMIIFNKQLIGFFKIDNENIIIDAGYYVYIAGGMIFFNFMNQIFTGMWTALGKSGVTLKATLVGLSINIILDPILIFGLGPIPKLGVAGAAMATVVAQLIVLIVFLIIAVRDKGIVGTMTDWTKFERKLASNIAKIGLPVGIQNMIFTGIAMVISRMITGFGDTAIAIQKVGSQIESISWMTAEGFGTAVNTMIAQNHGAKQEDRVDTGYKTAIRIMMGWGLFTTVALVFGAEPLFKIFISEPEMLPQGVDYLRILGLSQLFMCIELASSGAFQGLGKSSIPSITCVILNALRIPGAFILSKTSLGINGIWWAIAISTVLKGTILHGWFLYERRKEKAYK